MDKIFVKRVYDEPSNSDGARFLVDRVWPRGIKKERLQIQGWLKEIAPSQALRRWFNHDPLKWDQFQRRYGLELEDRPSTWEPVLEVAKRKSVTLLYGARNTAHNNAVALKAFLERKMKTSPSTGTKKRLTPSAV